MIQNWTARIRFHFLRIGRLLYCPFEKCNLVGRIVIGDDSLLRMWIIQKYWRRNSWFAGSLLHSHHVYNGWIFVNIGTAFWFASRGQGEEVHVHANIYFKGGDPQQSYGSSSSNAVLGECSTRNCNRKPPVHCCIFKACKGSVAYPNPIREEESIVLWVVDQSRCLQSSCQTRRGACQHEKKEEDPWTPECSQTDRSSRKWPLLMSPHWALSSIK